MIRISCSTDLPKVMVLIDEFCKESLSEYGFFVNPDTIKTVAEKIYGTSFVIDNDGDIDGVLGGQIASDLVSGQKYYQEIIWYVRKARRLEGVKLLRTLEKQAILWGCTGIVMALMANSKEDKLDKLYTALGYKPMETHYLKQLGG